MRKRTISLGDKDVEVSSITIDGIDRKDYPDLCDAYAASANYEDGTPLSDADLETLDNEYPDLIHELAHESLH
jgi:hypothetical protein